MNISDEAVEAAAGILEAFTDFTPSLARSLARSQLEAAAPHLMADAWDEGVRAALGSYVSVDGSTSNPYRTAGAGE